ncbi:response regulator [Cohnella endophytica]|uniref:Response regulator n=1 Tax=Cohnella endophytica TaxID=2419778 RepID=A0A494XXS9_9BACL|nr:response regulator [Cohnella endophytica]RKP53829.1 response regulator [Cohnella endophytica]
MNVLLADDERLVRSSLRSMLEELNVPIRIVGEAQNGEQMLEMVRAHSPDLIFVDIRMPKLDGLEAIRRGKLITPDASWVILTGFSEFKYAQDALRLGASNYLLKPAEPEELEKCVLKAMKEQHKTSDYLNYEFEHWMSAQLRSSGSENGIVDDGAYKGYKFASLTLIPHVSESKSEWTESLQKLAYEIQESISKQTGFKDSRSGIASLRGDALTCFWAFPLSDSRDEERLTAILERQTVSILSRFGELPVHLLQTGLCNDSATLLREMDELRALSPLRVFFPFRSSCIRIEDLRRQSVSPHARDVADQLIQLSELYHRKDYVGYLQKIASLKKIKSSALFEDRNCFKHACRFIAASIGSEEQEALSADHWYHALQRHGDAMLSAPDGAGPPERTDIVQRVMDYVDKHYMDEIAIGSLAGELNVTPNYLSTLFHKRNGVTFVKYLTNTRMLKAKELLVMKPDLKVQEVAQAVGYFSSRHFTKLFLEHFKCYPSDIRERNG